MSTNSLYIRDEGKGRPLVLVHGWSCPGQFFDDQTLALKMYARCIVPDLPGHGKTGSYSPLSIEASADALYEYLLAENLSDIVLCGWSMGALVIYSMIERHGSERLSSVVAIDMTPRVLNDEAWSNGTLNGLDTTQNAHVIDGIIADWSKLPGRIARRLFADGLPIDQELIDKVAVEIAREDPGLLREMWMSLTAQDFRPLLKSFPVPLHLASGARSQLYGCGVRQWHLDNVPDFHLHLFEQSGHAPHLEQPEAFNQFLLDVIQSD
ncbi:alpha/beta hydrolase [Roseibium porphyridii]|uniref:Alpha/beta hydrolase n=1 Tax=Roseibium porphyridii TaxID=2866279 RepID=A0ABY8FC78_9HYPH|nr:alpha/beta hydrolase [Roseibium sp. KMA01]WFE90875.1 alpha/beta hydrolase [Roseibium sp. KMA01]